MRKFIPISVVGLLVMALWALPAMAFVNVYADIEKDKNIYVNEYIDIYKLATVEVHVTAEGIVAAEAAALVNQENYANLACEDCAEKTAAIYNSVLLNTGITNVNQSVGNMNNQGNVVAVAIDTPRQPGPGDPTGGSGFSNAQASVDQKQWGIVEVDEVPVVDQVAILGNTIRSINILWRESIIQDSVNTNTGITNVNQAAGQMNNQANATALAVCLDGAVALSETDLGQSTILGAVYETNTLKTALIDGSISYNRGVTFVNQTSGNMANQGNALSLSYSQAGQ